MRLHLIHNYRLFILFLVSASISITVTAQLPDVEIQDADTLVAQQEYFTRDNFDSLPVTSRAIPADRLKEIKGEKKFWYADSSFSKKRQQEKNYTPFFNRDWVKAIFWILVIGSFVAALLWYLSGSNIGLFRKKVPGTGAGARAEEIPEDIFSIDYDKEIAKALARADHRLAVRLQFLQVLKGMSDKKLIQYRQDKTNLDYLFQLNQHPFYQDFFRIVRHYEYSWYGHFDVNENAYRLIAGDFTRLKHQLN